MRAATAATYDRSVTARRPPLVDLLLCAIGLVVTALVAAAMAAHGWAWYALAYVLLHAGLSALIAVRRTRPRLSFIATYALLALLALVVVASPVNLGVSPIILCAPLSLHAAARHLPAPWGITALLLGIAGAFASPATRVPGTAPRALIPLMILVMVTTYLVASGRRRAQLQHEAQLEHEREALARRAAERVQAARAEERTRIAREIHDVVGHSLTVTAVQARTALAIGEPEALRAGLEAVRDSSASALAQLRSLVGVLRADGPAPREVSGDLTALPAMVREAQAAAPHLEGDLPPASQLETWSAAWPAPVRLAVLRVAQESLTNMLRHAAAGPMRLRIRADAEHCTIETSNATAASFTPGAGLTGLRERVELLGGDVTARTSGAPPAQFLLTARIPLHPPTEEDR